MTKTKKLTLRDLEEHDTSHDTSLIRELEMSVDALVSGTEAAYCGQFFYDCRVYGLKEAKCYLLNFVTSKYGHDRHDEECKFNETYNRIINTLT